MIETDRVAHLIEAAAKAHPDKAAILAGETEISYGALLAQTNRLASTFAQNNMTGERVAFMLTNGLDILLTYLACFRTGTIATPVNYRYAGPELENALTVAEPRWLVIHKDKLDLLSKVDPAFIGKLRIYVAGAADHSIPKGLERFESLLSNNADPANLPEPGPDDAAVMFFTSGSTGRPKGVVHTQGSARAMLDSTAEAFDGVGRDDTIQVAEPQVHVSGFIASLTVLMAGGTVALVDTFDAGPYLEALRRYRPTLICTHIDVLVKLCEAPGIRGEDFSSLRGVYTGGEQIPDDEQTRFMALAGLPIQLGYGLTEAIWLTICREPHRIGGECIGKPVGGAALRIADSNGKVLPDGEIGEIQVKGPMVMREYWNNPEETAATLKDGWLRTGDSGRRDGNGDFWFAARIKELIVRDTSKITPGEIEAAIDTFDGVAQSAAVGVPDPVDGEVPVAFVEMESGRAFRETAILAYLKERIAAYKIPVRIEALDALPLTKSGKINHLALKEMAAQPQTVASDGTP